MKPLSIVVRRSQPSPTIINLYDRLIFRMSSEHRLQQGLIYIYVITSSISLNHGLHSINNNNTDTNYDK